MKLSKEQKLEKSKELSDVLKKVSHLYFTDYRGLKFKDMGELREKLRPMKCRYNVVKNSLLTHALDQAGIKVEDKGLLNGPMALLVVPEDDPVTPARVLEQFMKEHESMKITAGYVDGAWLDSAQCRQMSKLGTKPEMLGRLANTLYSSVAQVAWVVNAPIQELAGTLKALADKLETQEKGK